MAQTPPVRRGFGNLGYCARRSANATCNRATRMCLLMCCLVSLRDTIEHSHNAVADNLGPRRNVVGPDLTVPAALDATSSGAPIFRSSPFTICCHDAPYASCKPHGRIPEMADAAHADATTHCKIVFFLSRHHNNACSEFTTCDEMNHSCQELH